MIARCRRGWGLSTLLFACAGGSGEPEEATEGTAGSSVGDDDGDPAADSAPDDDVGNTTANPGTTSDDPDSSGADGNTDDNTDDGNTDDGGPVASAGCGLAGPASGDLVIDVDGVQGSYVLSLPADYDPATPYPLGFAFHGANRTGPQCQQGDCAGFQSAMEASAVLVYMTSVGGPGWTDDTELNVTFFETVLEHVQASYCIDESLVYTAGTSSGAHFVNILGCRFGDRLAAIAPVAGVLFETECGDPVASLVIHGVDDSSFEGGMQARDFWREHSGCTAETVPTIAEIHEAVVATPESHGCAAYQGCDPGVPVVWCEHSEGGYDGSTHGWPLFGGDRIWAFVSAL
jgi:polyhydroxybutyrate depolymerase